CTAACWRAPAMPASSSRCPGWAIRRSRRMISVRRARDTICTGGCVEERLQLARARIEVGRQPVTGRRVVLTGGGSQLEGIVELAEETFGMPARLGRARPFDAGAVQDLTAATTAVGLLRWASEDDGGLTFGVGSPNRDFTARLARIGQ